MKFGGIFRKITDDKQRDIVFPQWLSTPGQSGWGHYIDAYRQDNAQIFVLVGEDKAVHSLIDFRVESKPKMSVCHVKRLIADPKYKHDATEYDEEVAAPLLRWAMTYARHHGCTKITISCKTEAVASYKKMDFEESSIPGHPQEYTILEKKILYNVPFADDPINA